MDFNMVEKFLKLPINAIPEAPKNNEMIFVEMIPKTKLTATDMEFSDNIWSNLFCFTIFKL